MTTVTYFITANNCNCIFWHIQKCENILSKILDLPVIMQLVCYNHKLLNITTCRGFTKWYGIVFLYAKTRSPHSFLWQTILLFIHLANWVLIKAYGEKQRLKTFNLNAERTFETSLTMPVNITIQTTATKIAQNAYNGVIYKHIKAQAHTQNRNMLNDQEMLHIHVIGHRTIYASTTSLIFTIPCDHVLHIKWSNMSRGLFQTKNAVLCTHH